MEIDFTKVPIKGIDGSETDIDITVVPKGENKDKTPNRSVLQQFASYIGMNTPDLGELETARKMFANSTNEYSDEEVNTMKWYADKFFIKAWLKEGINKVLG